MRENHIKYRILAEVREEHDNLLNQDVIYNDYVSKKSMISCKNDQQCKNYDSSDFDLRFQTKASFSAAFLSSCPLRVCILKMLRPRSFGCIPAFSDMRALLLFHIILPPKVSVSIY